MCKNYVRHIMPTIKNDGVVRVQCKINWPTEEVEGNQLESDVICSLMLNLNKKSIYDL